MPIQLVLQLRNFLFEPLNPKAEVCSCLGLCLHVYLIITLDLREFGPS